MAYCAIFSSNARNCPPPTFSCIRGGFGGIILIQKFNSLNNEHMNDIIVYMSLPGSELEIFGIKQSVLFISTKIVSSALGWGCDIWFNSTNKIKYK